jgi:hypothetical protein
MIRSVLAAFVLITLTASSAAAEVARELTWDDLVPAAAPLDNPFAHLTQDQHDELILIARARADKRQGFITEVSPDYEDAIELTHKLKSEGIDVEVLLVKAEEIGAEIERRNHATVDELNGRMVRMPGYALPLEFTEGGVKEFLLVPYIGACIHVPPPPPNQVVFVRLDREFTADGLYTPVWITGRMTVQGASRSLSYVDGQAQVATGYTLDGITVEPYER